MIASMNIKILTLLVTIMSLTSCGNSDQHRYQGYVEGDNIYLAAPYSGALIKSCVHRGQNVKKGELLFQLDPDPQSLQVNETAAALKQVEQVYMDLQEPRRPAEIAAIQAQIGQASSQARLAAVRMKRNQTLFDKHVLDKDTLDASRERHQELLYLKAQFEANLKLAQEGSRPAQIKAQEAQIALVKSKMNQTQWQLTQKSVYAPAAGVIFDTYFFPGEFVGIQQPIAALLTPDNIHISFFVPASALPGIRVDQQITFGCDGCAENNVAIISYISPEAEYVPPLVYSRDNRDKLVFRVKAAISDSMKFKPGQPVIVTVPKND